MFAYLLQKVLHAKKKTQYPDQHAPRKHNCYLAGAVPILYLQSNQQSRSNTLKPLCPVIPPVINSYRLDEKRLKVE